MKNGIHWTVCCWLATGCGDSAGGSASDGGASTSAGSNSSGASSTGEGGASASDATSAPTEGGGSISGATSGATENGGSISDSQATNSTTPTTGASDSSGSSTSGDTTDGASATTTGDTTGGGSTGTQTTTDGESSGSTTEPPPPLMCGAPPDGFDGPNNAKCAIPPKFGTFTPAIEWTKTTWGAFPQYNQVVTAPIVVSLTDDNADGKFDDQDVPDIVVMAFAGNAYLQPGVLRVISGKNGAEILSIGPEQKLIGLAGIAGGDIDGDKIAEIVAVTTTGQVKAFEHDGQLKWATPEGTCTNLATPALADMDGDGKPEIVAGAAILNNDGSLRGKVKYGTGRLISVVADIDGDPDGHLEVVAGNAIYRPNGTEVWYNQKTDGWIGVADIDLNGSPDIVVVDAASKVRLQDNKGAVLWEVAMPGGGGGPPTIADYDGDGQPEIGIAGAAFYAVFEPDGKVLWQKPTQDLSSQITGSSVFDFEGDGAAEVLYGDELNVRVYAGTTGNEKLKLAGYGSGTHLEYPVVVDVDNDGRSEIVVVNNNYFSGNKTGVTVIGDADDSWRPARKIWNQHAYSITNVNDDGTIPTKPTPNYQVYNNFRSGDLSQPDGLKTPDLKLQATEPCTLECNDGKLVVWVHLGNEGAAPLTAGATIEVVGLAGGQVKTMQSTDIVDPLDAGKYAGAVAFEIDPAGLDSIEVKVTAKEQECDAKNNVVVIPGPFCEP